MGYYGGGEKERDCSIANLAHKRIAGVPVYLQQRYAFQAIKLWFYIGRSGIGLEPGIQKTYLDNLEGRKTIVAAWAKIYYAMIQQDANSRTLYLLKAFDESEEKKQFSFLRIDKDDLAALQRSTVDAYTNSLIHTMYALKTKGRALEHIKAVAKNDAVSKYLPLLISREINKLEYWLWTPEMLGFYEKYNDAGDGPNTKAHLLLLQKKDRIYLEQVRAFLEAFTVKNAKPPYQLALIHLYNIERNYAKANQLLRQLPTYTNKQHETQRLIEQVITTSHIEDIMQSATKEKLAASLNKLLQMNNAFKRYLDPLKYERWYDDDAELSDDLSELLLLLSRGYEKKGDSLTAGLLYTKANITTNSYDGWIENDVSYGHIGYYDKFASPADVDGVLALKHKANKNAFEKLLSPVRWAKDDVYKDVKGTILFRRRQYAAALATFKSMDPNFWKNNYEYKFYLPLKPITHTGVMPQAGNAAQKYKVVSKMLIMQDVVKIVNGIASSTDDETKAAWYYQLGNVQFNTSYHGKAWMMFSYGKSINEPHIYDEYPDYHWADFTFWPNDLKHGEDYYMCKSAIDNYRTALSLTNNKELKAKCLLGLVTCYRFTDYGIAQKEKPPYMKSRKPIPQYLQQMKSYYGTNAFKQAAVHCPDITNYVERGR